MRWLLAFASFARCLVVFKVMLDGLTHEGQPVNTASLRISFKTRQHFVGNGERYALNTLSSLVCHAGVIQQERKDSIYFDKVSDTG